MLELKNIVKDYYLGKKSLNVLKGINTGFVQNQFVSILGPSGCGKTTLLNIIGGLDKYTSGDLIINGKSTKDFTNSEWDAYRNKRIGIVFQSYNLIPQLTVRENVELSLILSGMSKKTREKRVRKALESVGLSDQIDKRPNQLSGGQQQRVAIARALINDPEILLADEPTGALDTKTSVQILNLLRKISKDKLVIMVTHNTELAQKYSNRIIDMLDGQITQDSENVVVDDELDEDIEKDVNEKTSMSFLTALKISAKNLFTKKGRTALVSLAGSIGIIGVALVLSLSNGVGNYIGNVERTTATTVPITIAPYAQTPTAAPPISDMPAYPTDDVIYPYEEVSEGPVQIHRNLITQDFVDYADKLVEQKLASSVLTNREYLDFNILTTRGEDSIIKVNQNLDASAFGGAISNATGLPTSIFHELYGEQDYTLSEYDIIKGKYPTKSNELLLVVDRFNRVLTPTLYELGLIDKNTLDSGATINFDDLLGKKYKIYTPSEFYGSEPTVTKEVDYYDIITDSTSKKQLSGFNNVMSDGTDLETFYNDDKHFMELEVVGIMRIKEDALVEFMPGSIAYTSALKDEFIKAIDPNSKVVSAAKDNWTIDPANASKITDLINAFQSGDTTQIDDAVDDIFSFYDVRANSLNEIQSLSTVDAFIKQSKEFSVEYTTPIFKTDEASLDITNISNISDLSFIDILMYVSGYSTISSVLIFPVGLDEKESIFEYLDEYNVDKNDADKVYYTDFGGDLNSTIGTMINIISIVLVGFSSIALVVSSVMTGVITYISVIERTKEIGILRAIGARKKDVGRLFEAESIIVGMMSGTFGVLVTLLLQIPVNIIVNNQFGEQGIRDIANLSWIAALSLIAISTFLTFIAGFIPAKMAANKDPVEALRSE